MFDSTLIEYLQSSNGFRITMLKAIPSQPAYTCSKSTTATPEQCVKFVCLLNNTTSDVILELIRNIDRLIVLSVKWTSLQCIFLVWNCDLFFFLLSMAVTPRVIKGKKVCIPGKHFTCSNSTIETLEKGMLLMSFWCLYC